MSLNKSAIIQNNNLKGELFNNNKADITKSHLLYQNNKNNISDKPKEKEN